MIDLKPREYQKSIFETTKNKNTLVVLPTGLGKTLIALLLTIERLKKFPGSKILFLAPTRPLVEQHFQTYKKQLPELFADLQLFTGAILSKQRKKIFQTAEIIFSTPQCIANDIKKELYSLHEISLLIIDEAHRCLKNYSYTQVVNRYKNQALNQRILGLTASPGSNTETVREICKHLDIQEIESRTRESEDVKPYIQDLDFNKIEVHFPQEFIEIRVLLKKIYDNCVEKLRKANLLYGPANKITLLKLQNNLARQASQGYGPAMMGMSVTAQAIKISHALELLETQTLSGLNEYLRSLIKQAEQKKSRAVQNITKSPEFNAALISLSSLITKKIEHPKISKTLELIQSQLKENKNSKTIIFTQFRETASSLNSQLNKIPQINSSVFVGQAKKGNTGLSQKEQKKIIEKFRKGEINVICSTSIGEEGLDIPEVSSVIFYEPIPSAIRKIQRAGRTARLDPGKLFILITKDTRDVAHHYASSARERKMHRTLSLIKDEIKNKPKTLNDFKNDIL